MPLSKSFAACTFAPVTKDKAGAPTTIHSSPIGTFNTTSFYLDSSGRSNFALPLQLTFSSKEDLNLFLEAKCLHPPPNNIIEASEEEREQKDDGAAQTISSLGFELKSFPIDDSKVVVVEGINIVSCSVEGESIFFNTDVTVRATSHNWVSPVASPRSDRGTNNDQTAFNIGANLEITPVLTVKKLVKEKETLDLLDLMALELGAIPDHMQKESSARVHETRLNSAALQVTLTHAFTIAVNSIPGPSLGNTLVSLTIRHSNTHSEPVSLTNIALHPGHSRQDASSPKNKNVPSGQHSIANMTKAVQWGYAPKSELSLPLTLNPRDAYSTVITVNAGEKMVSRSFVSPVSVTGVIGKEVAGDDSSSASYRRQRVVVAGEAQWTTRLVAVEPADAFRIDMKVQQSEVNVGEPMIVSLRIFNLSLESRDLMLLMAKDEHKGFTPKDDAVNTAVVSEVNGYTFGVWGICGEDDGTVRLNRDHELLAVDAALLLGEVMGQHAADAELRFVPLREGTLKVPNWKLYDKSAGKWYNCVHTLKIVAKANID